jgi:hypothetical protein
MRASPVKLQLYEKPISRSTALGDIETSLEALISDRLFRDAHDVVSTRRSKKGARHYVGWSDALLELALCNHHIFDLVALKRR